MNENNQTPFDGFTEAVKDDIIRDLESERDAVKAQWDSTSELLLRANTIIRNVTETLQTAWEDGELSDSLVEDLKSWLALETTEETEIEIVARWYVTVTHPKGMSLSDISVDVDEPDLDGDNCEFGYTQFIETEINEL